MVRRGHKKINASTRIKINNLLKVIKIKLLKFRIDFRMKIAALIRAFKFNSKQNRIRFYSTNTFKGLDGISPCIINK